MNRTLSYVFLIVLWVLPSSGILSQEDKPLRVWVSQQGTLLKARLMGVQGNAIVIQPENGSTLTVPLEKLSAADQEFVTNWAKLRGISLNAPAPAPTVEGVAAMETPAAAETTTGWPGTVEVDAKSLEITNGEQNPAERRFVYRSGAFQFTSQAPLANTLMRDVARDFELVNTLFQRFPWGWQPQPRNGDSFYFAELYETEEDYIKAGGGDNSSGWSKGNLILTKFKTLGLKKVGGKYARDAKQDTDGSLVSLVSRLVMAEMRDLCLPWSAMGLEEFLENAAYRNGTFDFARPERALKNRVEQVAQWDAESDVSRMVDFLHAPWSESRSNAVDLRRQYFLDGMLLVYFFGYLDGERDGARLHQYYRAVSQEMLAWRSYRQTGGARPRASGGSMSSRAMEHNQIVIAGRSKQQLHDEILEKFKTIGLRLGTSR